MRELNIGEILSRMRREKGVTQDEVAEYTGVSKASVSKWENNLSYPDITILPVLANYYHISIDELLGYQPQLEEKKIWEKYREFSSRFAERPFWETLHQVREFIRRYDSCYPLLFAMAQLLLNNFMLAPSGEEQAQVLEEAENLCRRIRKECTEIQVKGDAQMLEGIIYLVQGRPEQVFAVLGERIHPRMPTESLVAGAYQMVGNREKAMEIVQAVLYQELAEMIDMLELYTQLTENEEQKQLAGKRIACLREGFELDALFPHKMCVDYLQGAIRAAKNQDREQTLSQLQKLVHIILTEFQNFSIHGDEFFDRTKQWMEGFALPGNLPRDRRLMKEELLLSVTKNPVFDFLKEDPEFLRLASRLERYLKKVAE